MIPKGCILPDAIKEILADSENPCLGCAIKDCPAKAKAMQQRIQADKDKPLEMFYMEIPFEMFYMEIPLDINLAYFNTICQDLKFSNQKSETVGTCKKCMSAIEKKSAEFNGKKGLALTCKCTLKFVKKDDG